MRNFVCIVLATAVLFSSCGQRESENVRGPQPFPYPEVPGMITDRMEALDFMASHFWNGYIDSTAVFSTDTAWVGGVYPEAFREAAHRYAELLVNLPFPSALKAQEALINKLSTTEFCDSGKVFRALVEQQSKYLYDPNSDFRNEDLLIPILKMAIASDHYSDLEKLVFEMNLKDCSLNLIGSPAADFRFTDIQGHTSSLYQIKADRLLVFFSNPGCNACMDIIKALTEIPQARDLIDSGRLKVLNLYIDEDLSAWRDYLSVYPENWISAYDPDLAVKNVPLYNIRAIPSLYLLDRNKRVLLKDATLPALLKALGI